MSSAAWLPRTALGALTRGAAFLVCGPVLSCAGIPDDGSIPRVTIDTLDPTSYAALVHPVFEKRCGSLDCHGQRPRGLRVYGEDGLRLPNDAGRIPGRLPTTPAEIRATYVSIVGLQPEKTDMFARSPERTTADAYKLSILSKPLALERHRPGPSLRKGDPSEQCLTSWLVGRVDAEACSKAAQRP